MKARFPVHLCTPRTRQRLAHGQLRVMLAEKQKEEGRERGHQLEGKARRTWGYEDRAASTFSACIHFSMLH